VFELKYVPLEEFNRALNGAQDPVLRAELFAALCRINVLYMIAKAGSGRLDGSLSGLDMMAALHLHIHSQNSGQPDLFLSSKGHNAPALYAALLGLGRLDFKLLHRLGRLGGLPGHPDINTPGCLGNTGPLGLGLSKAKGMALARRESGEKGRLYVMLGDGELQTGQVWESLRGLVKHSLHEICILVDLNQVQDSGLASGGSGTGVLVAKFEAFGLEVERVDGHDMAALLELFSRQYPLSNRPRVVIANTIKGKGISFLEKSGLESPDEPYRLGLGAPSPEAYEEGLAELFAHANALLARAGLIGLGLESMPLHQINDPRMSEDLIEAYGQALLKQALNIPELVFLNSGSLWAGGLEAVKRKFPARVIECGMAQQDMVSSAGGLALKGRLPLCHGQAAHLASGASQQIYNNATEHTRVVYSACQAGLLPGAAGHSQQAVRDIAVLSGIPGLVMFQPANQVELHLGLDYCLKELRGSVYFRLSGAPQVAGCQLPDGYRPRLGRGVELKPGSDAVIISHGPVMLGQALAAARRLEQQAGLMVRVVGLPWLNRVDSNWLLQAVAGCKRVFTLDDHYVEGGQGQMIAARLAASGKPVPPVSLFGVDQVPACGRDDEVLAFHRLDSNSLAQRMAGEL
jgi:transketolase